MGQYAPTRKSRNQIPPIFSQEKFFNIKTFEDGCIRDIRAREGNLEKMV